MAKLDPSSQQQLDALDALLSEVTALNLRLRQIQTPAAEHHALLDGGRNILQVLSQFGDCTVPTIARRRAISRQSVQISVNRLAKSRCVELVPNPGHKRSPLVRITEKGKSLLLKTSHRHEEVLAGALGSISPDELSSASLVLRRVRHLLGNEADPIRSTLPVPRVVDAPPPDLTLPMAAAIQTEVEPAFDGELPVNLL